jgi:hypothetical protein
MVNVFNALARLLVERLTSLGAGCRELVRLRRTCQPLAGSNPPEADESLRPDPSSLKELRCDRPVFVRNSVKNEDCHGVALNLYKGHRRAKNYRKFKILDNITIP